MAFRMELAQVQECSICGQNMRADQALPLTCLPMDPVTRQVRYDFLIRVFLSCPSCLMPLSPSEAVEVERLWTEFCGKRKKDEVMGYMIEKCPPGSAGLPWDWSQE